MCALPYPKEIRTLLVDDEEIAIHRLKKALQAWPVIHIIGEASDGHAAIQFINSQRPDLVFLDIQMPEVNGFDVLSELEYTPLIVFVTAYEEYAIKAFEQNSLDYLLKPVEEDRLALTIQRVMENNKPEAHLLAALQQLLKDRHPEEKISTIPVKSGNKIQLVHVSEICYLEAKDKYVYIHTRDQEKLIEYSLAYLQDRLPPEFIRVHRSFIINKLKIREIHRYFKGTFLVTMNDIKGSKIKSAYSYYEAINSKLLHP